MAKGKGDLKGLGDILALGAPPKPNPAMAGGDMGDDAEASPDDENAFGSEGQKPDEMMVGAAHDVMSALRAKDPENFAAAMKSFVSMC